MRMSVLDTRQYRHDQACGDRYKPDCDERFDPSRGLLGFRSEFIRLTRGQGMMTSAFSEYRPWAGDIGTSRSGVLVSFEAGETTAYAMKNLEDRGIFFIKPRAQAPRVYRRLVESGVSALKRAVSGARVLVGELAPGATATVTFAWNTAGVSTGTHTLVATHGLPDDNAAARPASPSGDCALRWTPPASAGSNAERADVV